MPQKKRNKQDEFDRRMIFLSGALVDLINKRKRKSTLTIKDENLIRYLYNVFERHDPFSIAE